MNYSVALESLPEIDGLAKQWRALERVSEGSFFVSWTWIGAWLETVVLGEIEPDDVRLIRVVRDNITVGLGIVCRHNQRLWVLNRSLLALHQTGNQAADGIWIEYNGLLAATGEERDVTMSVLQAFARMPAFGVPGWSCDEMRWSGVGANQLGFVQTAKLPLRIDRRNVCPWVDLTILDDGLEGYLARLSSNARQQIRRSVRLWGDEKSVSITRASGADFPQQFEQFKRLHIATWQSRSGHDGAFANKYFENFAKRLFALAEPTAQVDLMTISLGTKTVGLLLNFQSNGHVYAYQSGFQFGNDNREKPGLAAHALAIADYKQRGAVAYHFMGGGGRYKASLGTQSEDLYWVNVGRDNWRTRLMYRIEAARNFGNAP